MDFWEKFHQEWEELNRREEMRHAVKRNSLNRKTKCKPISKIWAGGQWSKRLPSKFWAGGPKRSALEAVQTDKTVSRISSADKTRDGSQRPCRRVWMPSLLGVAFRPRSQPV